ncbi:MAG: hypothetical protein HYY16_11510 [Planctomycetes bacterium]|nr:hypothetical protein [Planctomycetota bacterium]
MSFKSADPATSVAAAASWCAVAVFSFWCAWGTLATGKLTFLIAVALGLMMALMAGGYAIESLSQEMTIRRWAISQLVFTVFGVVFAVAGIFGGMPLPTWLLFVGAALFLFAAVLCALAAKELF